MALQQRRVHVGPQDFGHAGATDYWINFTSASNQVAAASATNPAGMSGWLHTTTSLVATAGTTGDFNASGDNTPSHVLTDASGDAFVTPRQFGGYAEFQRVSQVLGYTPTKLYVDVYAAFTVSSANENTSFFGLVAPSVTDITAAGGGCGIMADGTNFRLKSDNGNDAGLAVDNAWRLWRQVVDSTNTEWFTDGTSQGTITTETDIWPLSFKMIVGTTNRIGISWIHIWYG